MGAAVLVTLAAARRRLLTGAGGLSRRPLVLAAGATASYQLCFFGGVRLAGVAIGTLVGVGSGPVWGGLLGWFGRKERPSRRWAVATALGIAGVAALAAFSRGEAGDVDPLGIVLALGAGLSYAAFALWSKDLTDHHDPDLVMTWVFLLSALALVPIGLAAGIGPLLTPDGTGMVLWLGVVSLAAAYLLFGRGIAGVTVGVATTLSLAEPLTAATLGLVVLDERLTPGAWGGVALVLAGLVALTLPAVSGRPTRRRP